jgi:hypothetical protein
MEKRKTEAVRPSGGLSDFETGSSGQLCPFRDYGPAFPVARFFCRL